MANGTVGLVDHREDNGPTKVSEGYASEVLAAVAGSPREHGYDRPTWTQELLNLVVEQKTSVGISRTTMSRLLQRLDVRNGRPKHVLTPGQSEKRYLAGALDHQTGRLHWVEGTSKSSALFISLVDDLVRNRCRKTKVIHLVLDNFKIHSSKAVQAAAGRWEKRVLFHFLPPYCPDANRIARRWKDRHDNVTLNHTCRSMDELMETVRQYLCIRCRTGKHSYNAAA